MEQHDKKYYEIICQSGKKKQVLKNSEIGNAKMPTIDEMSDIGKLTDLFWGYNIVDKEGMVMRKFKFLSKYPVVAKKVLKWIYPEYFYMKEERKKEFRDRELNIRMQEVGFSIQKTNLTR